MGLVTGTVYATRTDLNQIGILAQALVNVPTAAQDEALQAASAVADSQLQGQYILPIINWSYDLVRAVCAIAAWDCLTVRGYSPQAQGDQNIRLRYEDAMAWLDRVSKGQESPAYITDSSVAAGGQTLPPPADGSVVFSTSGGFQLQTTAVRGWTDRGVPARSRTDNGTGPL